MQHIFEGVGMGEFEMAEGSGVLRGGIGVLALSSTMLGEAARRDSS